MTDQQQIEAIFKGDRKTLEAIYKTHQGEFTSWLQSKYEVDRDTGLEIYQDSFLIFYKNVMSARLQTLSSSIKTYLFAVGKNKMREKFRTKLVPIGEKMEDNIVEEDNSLLFEDLQEERLNLVIHCLEKIGESCKKLLEAFYFLKMSMDKIAEELEYKNAATVKNLKYKCITRLRDMVYSAA